MTARADQRYIIVVANGAVDNANNLAWRVHTNHLHATTGFIGTNVFSPPGLGVTTNGAVQAYWCNWNFTDVQWQFLTNKGATLLLQTNSIRIFNASTTTPDLVLSELGLVIKGSP